MLDGCMRSEIHTIDFVLLPQFSLIAFASTIEPLREANWVSGRSLYRWRLLTVDGASVEASNGMRVDADASISSVARSKTVVVCASFDPQLYASRTLLSWLRKQSALGADIGAVETGTYILAKAGLLDGYRATIHWENIQSVANVFEKVILTDSIFEIDRNRFSVAGGTAGLDLMLHLIRQRHGHELAATVSEEFIYNRIRDAGDPQRLAVAHRLGIRHKALIDIIKRMEVSLEDRLSIDALSSAVGISAREVQRLFKAHIGTTPKRYYQRLRLSRARLLLRQTNESIFEIALQCGFNSAADFSRSYRTVYGKTPRSDREGHDK